MTLPVPSYKAGSAPTATPSSIANPSSPGLWGGSNKNSTSGNHFAVRHCTTINSNATGSISNNNDTTSHSNSDSASLSFRDDLNHQTQIQIYRDTKVQRRQAARLIDENQNNLLSLLLPFEQQQPESQQLTSGAVNTTNPTEGRGSEGGRGSGEQMHQKTMKTPTKPLTVITPQISSISLSPSATVDAARWSLCALITEATRYHREHSSKSGEHRLFHLPEAMNMEPVAFGSAMMTKLLVSDTHKLFSEHGCEVEESRRSAPLLNPSNGGGDRRPIVDPLLCLPTTKNIIAATQACRHQLAMLDQWSLPIIQQRGYSSSDDEGSDNQQVDGETDLEDEDDDEASDLSSWALKERNAPCPASSAVAV